MKVPLEHELKHMQLQAMLREHSFPDDEVQYLGEREYTTEYAAHPEFHGQMMHWYLIAGEHEVPVCDIASVDQVDN